MLAFDLETDGLHADDGVVVKAISWCNDEDRGIVLLDHDSRKEAARAQRLIEKSKLIAHNLKFDLSHWRASFETDLIDQAEWDTMLAARVIEPHQPSVALKRLAEAHWGLTAIKAEQDILAHMKENRIKKGQYWRASEKLFRRYSLVDAVLCWKLYKLQLELLECDDGVARKTNLIEREMQVMRRLYGMEQRGIGWDAERAEKAADRLRIETAKIAKKLPFKATDAGAADYYYNQHDYIPTKMTGGGKSGKPKPSIDKQSRLALMSVHAPYVEEYDRFKTLKTAEAMWYGGWTKLLGADGRLRTSFRQGGTVNYRFSVERVQLQAIPHDYQYVPKLPKGVPPVRELIIAKPGHVLFELDVSQAEIRVATSVARCKRMREIILAGGDIHDATCTDLFNYGPDDEEWKKYRSISKRLNFAMVYGVGAHTFIAQMKQFANVDMSEREARQLIGLHHEVYPEFPRAAWHAERVAKTRGFVKLCSGMERWFQPWEELHKAFNAVIQGGVAEAMKDAMIEIDRRWPGVLLLQIHDSVLCEIDRRKMREVSKMGDVIAKSFEHYFKLPFVVDHKAWTA